MPGPYVWNHRPPSLLRADTEVRPYSRLRSYPRARATYSAMLGLVVSGLFRPFLFNLTISCMRTSSLNLQGRTES